VLLSPVGNKINLNNLTTNVAETLPFQNRSNIDRLCLSHDGQVLISVDVDGFALIVNMLKKVVIAHFNFRDKVTALEFSPDNAFFMVATGTKVKIFEAPSALAPKTFSPLVLYKKYNNLHSQPVTGVQWTNDSRFFLTWSANDLTLKLMSLHKLPNFLPITFAGNKKPIVKAFFSADNKRVFTIANNGTLLIWRWTEEVSTEAKAVLQF
jgi:periodic tryptophan protein 2